MPTNVIMPALEMAQQNGKVIRWLKRAGDTVAKGEPIVEIETDKISGDRGAGVGRVARRHGE
jgi:pyruvate/2-oxoglutarate dehydrogenase complex dihydrolipoamide acyltransferase (E2) component